MKAILDWLRTLLSIGPPTVFLLSSQLPGTSDYSSDEEATIHVSLNELAQRLQQAKDLTKQGNYNEADVILDGLTVTVSQIPTQVSGRQAIVNGIESLKAQLVQIRGFDE
jgi:septation ring formation regulator EzrA